MPDRSVGRTHRLWRTGSSALLAVAAIVSTVAAIGNALENSDDFRLDAARALASGVNPFDGAEGGTFYLHGLYVLLLPLTGLEDVTARAVYAAMNILMGIAVVLMLSRALNLGRDRTLFLLLVMAASMPFRVTVGNAQTGLIILAFSAPLFLFGRRRWPSLGAGLSLVKWSFAPPLALWILLRRSIGTSLLAAATPVVGFLIFAALTADFSLMNLLRPALREREILVDPGYADLMTLIRLAAGDGPATLVVPALAMAAASFAVVRRFHEERTAYAALLIISLVTVYHLSYDLIVLLPAAAVALREPRRPAARGILLISGYFFFIDLPQKLLAFVVSRTSSPSPRVLEGLSDALDSMVTTPGIPSVLAHLLLLSVVIVLLHRLGDRSGSLDAHGRRAR